MQASHLSAAMQPHRPNRKRWTSLEATSVTPGSYPLHPALTLLTTGSLAVFAPRDADAVGALRHVPCRFDTLDVPQYPQLRQPAGGMLGHEGPEVCTTGVSSASVPDGHGHTLRAKERPRRSVPTAAVDVPEGWAPGLCRSAACRRRRRFSLERAHPLTVADWRWSNPGAAGFRALPGV